MDFNRFDCPFQGCTQSYKLEKTLRRHIEALHSSSKKYQCETCLKRMSSTQNLKEHKHIHTGEKPYLCTETGCNASFRQGSQLTAHKRVHRVLGYRATQNCFIELKVSFKQLTDLIHTLPNYQDSLFYSDGKSFEEGEIALPPISEEKQYGPLPELFN